MRGQGSLTGLRAGLKKGADPCGAGGDHHNGGGDGDNGGPRHPAVQHAGLSETCSLAVVVSAVRYPAA